MIRTFKFQDYLPILKTAEVKKESGLGISVVLPALNEESTIESIVRSLRKLMDTTGLIDEIVVMDCASEDRTVSYAENAGATVYQVASVVPEVKLTGKGVALWKSQFVTTGDILLFVDSDIIDFNERFVVGLAGVMLENPAIEMVKASYERPLVFGDWRMEHSGGRVTELFVRPLLNLFLPELSGFCQPLAGEYAVRKLTLETMPIYSGYGVEIGLLLEYYFKKHLTSFGQVEMGTRLHRNRGLPQLSRMAFEIGHVVFSCLAEKSFLPPGITFHPVFESRENGSWEKYAVHYEKLLSKKQIECGGGDYAR